MRENCTYGSARGARGNSRPYRDRREFITLIGGAAAWPLAARAQQPDRMRRIGVLMSGAATATTSQSYVAMFVEALRQLGWTEGQNVRVDIRWNAGDAQLTRIYAAQLIGLMPDVILAATTANLEAIQQATSTVPVVFTQVSDPVAQGFVASVAKPGGNLTGFSAYEFSIGGKWLELLKEIAPGLARIGVMFNPDTSPQSKFFMRSIEAAAPTLDGCPRSLERQHRTCLREFRGRTERRADPADRHLHNGRAPQADRPAGGPPSPAGGFLEP